MPPVLESIFSKNSGLQRATLLKKASVQVFSCKFCECLNNSFLQNTFKTAVSLEDADYLTTNIFYCVCGNHYWVWKIVDFVMQWNERIL